MPYRDTWVECTQCSKQFVFRLEEQRSQAAQGREIVIPELCPECRGQRRSTVGRSSAPSKRPETSGSRTPRRTRPPSRPQEKAALGHGPHEGEVKWFSLDKGYGFLVHPSGTEIFFHRTSLAPGESEHLLEGTRVSFLIEETDRGPQAVEVERLE